MWTTEQGKVIETKRHYIHKWIWLQLMPLNLLYTRHCRWNTISIISDYQWWLGACGVHTIRPTVFYILYLIYCTHINWAHVHCRGGWGEMGQGRTGTPLITSVVFSQSASRKHFFVALSCHDHISLQNQIADKFVSAMTKLRFLV